MLRLFKLSLCALFVGAVVATAGCGGDDKAGAGTDTPPAGGEVEGGADADGTDTE